MVMAALAPGNQRQYTWACGTPSTSRTVERSTRLNLRATPSARSPKMLYEVAPRIRLKIPDSSSSKRSPPENPSFTVIWSFESLSLRPRSSASHMATTTWPWARWVLIETWPGTWTASGGNYGEGPDKPWRPLWSEGGNLPRSDFIVPPVRRINLPLLREAPQHLAGAPLLDPLARRLRDDVVLRHATAGVEVPDDLEEGAGRLALGPRRAGRNDVDVERPALTGDLAQVVLNDADPAVGVIDFYGRGEAHARRGLREAHERLELARGHRHGSRLAFALPAHVHVILADPRDRRIREDGEDALLGVGDVFPHEVDGDDGRKLVRARGLLFDGLAL